MFGEEVEDLAGVGVKIVVALVEMVTVHRLDVLLDPGQGTADLVTELQVTAVEVDLDRQIMFAIDADGTVTTINVSTGSGREFQSAEEGKGIVVAHTPIGEYNVIRRIDALLRRDSTESKSTGF